MIIVNVNDREEYDYILNQGYQPLISPNFEVRHQLRISVQRELFGHGNKQAHNQKFYKWVWKYTGPVHECQECNMPLQKYSAAFISHILSRKAYPEMAYDPRNVNILCVHHHHQWEYDPHSMGIYHANMQTIQKLKSDYVIKPNIVRV